MRKRTLRYPSLIHALILFSSIMGSYVYAAPEELVNVNLECPRTKNDGGTTGINVLHNDGLLISGYGKEIINGKSYANPIFAGPTLAGVPTRIDMGEYYRADTAYNPENGKVTCYYLSTSSYPPFTVRYVISNGRTGTVKYKTPKSIYISYTVGLKK